MCTILNQIKEQYKILLLLFHYVAISVISIYLIVDFSILTVRSRPNINDLVLEIGWKIWIFIIFSLTLFLTSLLFHELGHITSVLLLRKNCKIILRPLRTDIVSFVPAPNKKNEVFTQVVELVSGVSFQSAFVALLLVIIFNFAKWLLPLFLLIQVPIWLVSTLPFTQKSDLFRVWRILFSATPLYMLPDVNHSTKSHANMVMKCKKL